MNDTDEITRILFVEDAEADVELAQLQLVRDGLRFTWKRVATEVHLHLALAGFRPHVVLGDYRLPGFSVRTVISLGRELGFMVLAEGVETEAQLEMLEANHAF